MTRAETPTPIEKPDLLDPHHILGAFLNESPLLEFSGQFDKLIEALAEAQADFDEIPKNRTGKVSGKNDRGYYEYEYNYADISDVLKECRPKCAKRGIVITQQPRVVNQKLTIVTMLVHKSQQWMRCELEMPMQNPGRANPNQVLGGQITYLRRYPLCAMLGVQAEEDLDAQETGANATGNTPSRVDSKPRPSNADTTSELEGCINGDQQQQLKDALAITGISMQSVAKHIGDAIGELIKPMPQHIPADQFELAMNFINRTADEENS